MCGRYDLTELALELFELMVGEAIKRGAFELKARYNIAPSQTVLIIRRGRGSQLEVVETRWGLLPFWSKQPKVAYNTIKARAETVGRAPAGGGRSEPRAAWFLPPASMNGKSYLARPASNHGACTYAETSVSRLLVFGIIGMERADYRVQHHHRDDAAQGLRTVHDRMPVILSPEGARV